MESFEVDDNLKKLHLFMVFVKADSRRHAYDSDACEIRGSSILVRCPFHKEKTPSMAIKIKGLSFHCFGCGETGQVDYIVGDDINKVINYFNIEKG